MSRETTSWKPTHASQASSVDQPPSQLPHVKWYFVCTSDSHNVTSCDRFLQMTSTLRAMAVRQASYCFGCLRGKHRVAICRNKPKCEVEACTSKHHTLLHGAERVFPKPNINSAIVPRKDSKVLLMVVPLRIPSGEKLIDTFGLLGNGSDATLIREDIKTTRPLRCITSTAIRQFQWLREDRFRSGNLRHYNAQQLR